MEYKNYLVALGLALASYSAFAECEWSNPGGDKYMLPLAAAVDKLTYIPEPTRVLLKNRLDSNKKHLEADDHILMTSSSVTGTLGTWAISNMNGGNGKICWGPVTTKTWGPEHSERALVFCENGWCLAYFSVCRNIASAILVEGKKPDNFLAKMTYGTDYSLPIPEYTIPEYSFDFSKTAVDPGTNPSNTERTNNIALNWFVPMYFGSIVYDPQWQTVPVNDAPVTPIPEPSILMLLALGLLVVAYKVRK